MPQCAKRAHFTIISSRTRTKASPTSATVIHLRAREARTVSAEKLNRCLSSITNCVQISRSVQTVPYASRAHSSHNLNSLLPVTVTYATITAESRSVRTQSVGPAARLAMHRRRSRPLLQPNSPFDMCGSAQKNSSLMSGTCPNALFSRILYDRTKVDQHPSSSTTALHPLETIPNTL
jgi:hypothetical protein